jgi:hypothetical protein
MSVTNELEKTRQKLVNEAGKAMVKKAIDDLVQSPEEKRHQAAQDEAAARMRVVKVILGGVGVVVVGIVVMRVLMRLWLWGIAIAIVGGLGAAAWFTFKPQLHAWQAKRLAVRAQAEAARTEQARHDAARDAAAAAQRSLDEELARLKKQL